jgi:hypothetical protein
MQFLSYKKTSYTLVQDVGLIIWNKHIQNNWKSYTTSTHFKGRMIHIQAHNTHIINLYSPARRIKDYPS